MTQEKWDNLKAMVREKFGIDEERTEGLKPVGEVEIMEFNGPLGRIKLEHITKPRVLEKKTTYSRRIGGDVKVDYVYSDDELVKIFKAYKWDEGRNNWLEMEAGNFEF